MVKLLLHSKEYVSIGEKMLTAIKQKKIDIKAQSRITFCKEASCTMYQYYALLKLLVDAELVKKEQGKYLLCIDGPSKLLNEWISYMQATA